MKFETGVGYTVETPRGGLITDHGVTHMGDHRHGKPVNFMVVLKTYVWIGAVRPHLKQSTVRMQKNVVRFRGPEHPMA